MKALEKWQLKGLLTLWHNVLVAQEFVPMT